VQLDSRDQPLRSLFLLLFRLRILFRRKILQRSGVQLDPREQAEVKGVNEDLKRTFNNSRLSSSTSCFNSARRELSPLSCALSAALSLSQRWHCFQTSLRFSLKCVRITSCARHASQIERLTRTKSPRSQERDCEADPELPIEV
jgi:hypothetical protein